MRIEDTLDKIHAAVTRKWWTQLFTAFTRCIIAVGFIPPSIPKILHKPFTVLPDSNPVGHYFNALLGTGYYYEFIGWSQLIAAILLLIPRTSHIGALLFFPIILNIAVLTNSVGFAGTWLITIFMALAGLYMVAWEYDRLKPIIFFNRDGRTRRFSFQLLLIPIVFAVGGIICGLLAWSIRLGNLPNYFGTSIVLAGLGAIFGFVVAIHYRMMRVGSLSDPLR
ncbi:MAG: hypothetical protein UZ17_ACD001000577 [Acidobacteria bacterium OLB17]|nr:MAG: hypothetical protein UZ17_ACD001000577 [Acidobacteria bacterium OLB17]MCZ2389511.1 hypothetical protein [Acidobacteriota bacterium]